MLGLALPINKYHFNFSEVEDVFQNSISSQVEHAEDTDDEDCIAEVTTMIKECRELIQVRCNLCEVTS